MSSVLTELQLGDLVVLKCAGTYTMCQLRQFYLFDSIAAESIFINTTQLGAVNVLQVPSKGLQPGVHKRADADSFHAVRQDYTGQFCIRKSKRCNFRDSTFTARCWKCQRTAFSQITKNGRALNNIVLARIFYNRL